MGYAIIATIDDVQTSSSQTLVKANNYTNVAIPQQIQDVLKPLLPAKPSEVSNTTWDFKTQSKDEDGNDVDTWNACPTIDYVDQSANISLDISKAKALSAKAEAIQESNKYTDAQLASLKETVTSLQIERGLTTFDVIMLLNALTSKGGLEWQQ